MQQLTSPKWNASKKQEEAIGSAPFISSKNHPLIDMPDINSMKSTKKRNEPVLRAAMVKPGMRHSGHSEIARFSQRLRRFWHLSSAPTLILLAKAKMFKGPYMCYNFSASKSG